MNRLFLTLTLAAVALSGSAKKQSADNEVAVFITLGQSNADGSAFFDPELDAAAQQWYTSDANKGKMKMWYRSTKVENQPKDSLGEHARWVMDGTITDVEPGWLNLWYRNENTEGRTAMNMIHGYGTYSTGTGTDCAQGRRGMEGQFGIDFATALPDEELYMIKLGASGSGIATWADPRDSHNWEYFINKVYIPAMTDLLAQGKRPRLAGIWWMQGCADAGKTSEYYGETLGRLIEQLRTATGFPDAQIYVGHVVKPGENPATPDASVQFGQGVRDAQDSVAAATKGVKIIDTSDCTFQYEKGFKGHLHYDHAGVNKIGSKLAKQAVDSRKKWARFTTPGYWETSLAQPRFVPAFGSPEITYTTKGKKTIATLTYPGFTETKTYTRP